VAVKDISDGANRSSAKGARTEAPQAPGEGWELPISALEIFFIMCYVNLHSAYFTYSSVEVGTGDVGYAPFPEK